MVVTSEALVTGSSLCTAWKWLSSNIAYESLWQSGGWCSRQMSRRRLACRSLGWCAALDWGRRRHIEKMPESRKPPPPSHTSPDEQRAIDAVSTIACSISITFQQRSPHCMRHNNTMQCLYRALKSDDAQVLCLTFRLSKRLQ